MDSSAAAVRGGSFEVDKRGSEGVRQEEPENDDLVGCTTSEK